MVQRLSHAGLVGADADRRPAAVVDAIGDHRPAMVGASRGDVHFIAALRAVFVGPELTGPGVERRALRVAVSPTPHFRARAGAGEQWVVVRNATVVVQANNAAGVVIQTLSAALVATVAQGDEQQAVAVKNQSAAEVTTGIGRGLDSNYHHKFYRFFI